jgi:CHASE2 domain-containing sensor protein
VVINIGYLDRKQIASQIEKVAKYKPKVIGVNVIFSCKGDPLECLQTYDTLANKKLVESVSIFDNIVLAEMLHEKDSIEHSMLHNLRLQHEGYVNLENEATEEHLRKIRRFVPSTSVKGQKHYAFAVQMAFLYDSVRTNRFLKSGRTLINFRGNSDYFNVRDWNILADDVDLSYVKDKVVILGFLGADLSDTSWDDRFFTPLNYKVMGLTRPDMFGVVVHANITAMILNGDTIGEFPDSVEYLITFLICFLHVFILLLVHDKYSKWYDSAAILLIVVQLILFSFLRIFVFEVCQFKIYLATTLGTLTLASIAVSLYHGPLSMILGKNRES